MTIPGAPRTEPGPPANPRFAAIALALWTATVVPLSVDAASVRVGNYDVRATYAAYAAATVLLVVAWLRRDDAARTAVREWQASRAPWAFGAMALAGAASLTYSENATRSAFYLAWTAGTLLAVPLVTDFLVRTLGALAPRVLALYLTVQMAAVTIDAALAHARPDLPRLGTASWGGRPHAWYQEPSYFGAFVILGCVWLRMAAARDPDVRWRRFLTAACVAALVTAFVANSRTGFVGAALLVACECVAAARRLRRSGAAALGRNTLVAAAVGVWMIAVVAFVTDSSWAAVSLANPSGNGSLRERVATVRAEARVFADHPWTGSGPGASGAQLLARHADDPLLHLRYGDDASARAVLQDAPLSLSVWTEVPTEWGLVGASAFAAGLVLVLRRLRGIELALTIAALGVAWSTCQTVARFDLWVAVSLIRALSYRPAVR